MSESDSDSAQIGAPRQRKQTLFRSSDAEDDASLASSSPKKRRAPAPAPARAPRAAPRFLGDSDGEEHDTTPYAFASRAVPGDVDVDDLFGDLDSIANSRAAPPKTLPARLDPHALDKYMSAPRPSTSAPNVDAEGIDSVWQNGDGDAIDGISLKKRRVVARMDEARLLGPTGFPALLVQIQKGGVRIKGKKGTEREDLKRLLGTYQLWAHAMYPKFNLRDSLATVERLCHKRAVQVSLLLAHGGRNVEGGRSADDLRRVWRRAR